MKLFIMMFLSQLAFASELVTIEGTLQLQDGEIVLTNSNVTYFVPRLGQYIGFITELKEGAAITVEGYVDYQMLHPTKFSVNDKSYDLKNTSYRNSYYGGHQNGRHRNGNWGGCRNWY